MAVDQDGALVQGSGASMVASATGRGRRTRHTCWRRLKRRPFALVGTGIFLAFLSLLAVFGPYVAPYSYSEQDVINRLQPPSLSPTRLEQTSTVAMC